MEQSCCVNSVTGSCHETEAIGGNACGGAARIQRAGRRLRAQSTLDQSPQSSADYSAAQQYNLANAYARSGKSALAVLAYERARLLTPTDPDLRWNLHRVRESVGLPDDPGSWSEKFGRFANPMGCIGSASSALPWEAAACWRLPGHGAHASGRDCSGSGAWLCRGRRERVQCGGHIPRPVRVCRLTTGAGQCFARRGRRYSVHHPGGGHREASGSSR